MADPKITNITSFSRGTTPTVTSTISPPEVLEDATLHLCFNQEDKNILLKSTQDLTVDALSGKVEVDLTQEETLMFSPGVADVQLRGVDQAGSAWATDIKKMQVLKILENSVIVYGE